MPPDTPTETFKRALAHAARALAEQDELDRFEIAWPVFPVRGDFLHQRTEQIVTTVNVSDSVDALASSRAGLASVFAKEPQHSAIMAQGLQNVR